MADVPMIRPFRALRPAPGRAAEVAAPPYDVVSTEEARRLADGMPWSFLRISKPEINLPPGTDAKAPEVYAKGAEYLARMIAGGVLKRDLEPSYYVYRMKTGAHVQTGIAAAGSIAAYRSNRIRRHELTHPDKEDDRVRQIEALGAQTGPVFAAHRADGQVAEVVAGATGQAPAIDINAGDGVDHSLWVVADRAGIDHLSRAFEAMDTIYIADGHHRSAAAARVAAARRRANPAHRGDESYNSFLMVSFPDSEVRILDYNRVVRDLGGLGVEGFLAKVSQAFTIEVSAGPARPAKAGEFGLYTGGQWYRLAVRGAPPVADDPAARLDVSLLGRHLLHPVLGIGDPRTDPRVECIGGGRGLGELERLVDGGDWSAAFALYPTSLGELIAVADAGLVMPPKSTWFEPKLADGLLSLVLD
ncbi:MAG TPA: DUF1015 domain-containing protein [Rhodospirillales bacterium]|nr:DUF1015 domain-containing protein [Rhodospirillales bacterium]